MIRKELEQIASLCGHVQKMAADTMVADLKEVRMTSVYDVFTKFEIARIKRFLRRKECYRNALLLSLNRNVTYCEGKVAKYGIVFDHAFNKIGDKYVDITWELLLGDDVTELEYGVLGEYDSTTAQEVALNTGVYGGVYEYKLRERINARKN